MLAADAAIFAALQNDDFVLIEASKSEWAVGGYDYLAVGRFSSVGMKIIEVIKTPSRVQVNVLHLLVVFLL